MDIHDYLRCDATELARRVGAGEVTAERLLELAQQRLAIAQPRVNAVVRRMDAQAQEQLCRLREAPAGPRPFGGVPFLLKDILQDYAGVPTGQGSRSCARNIPTEHAYVVRRYLAAGLVPFGKTNLPEFALKAVTDSRVHGVASNPWDLARTPGGSSGGAAAAVACGVVPLAAANDGGGSIRIPAACCGIFGLRPSRGRISPGPAYGEVWYGASSEGVLSRSVRDTARALDVLQGPESGDPYVIAPPALPYAQAHRLPPGRLRIGYSADSPIGTPVHAHAVAALEDAVSLLRTLGHDLVPAQPEVDGPALASTFLHIYFGHVAASVRALRSAGAQRGDFELLTRVLAVLGNAISAGTLATHLERVNGYARALGRFHDAYDLFLTPSLAHPPIRHGTVDPPAPLRWALQMLEPTGVLRVMASAGGLDGIVDKMARDNLQYVPYTQLANLTGTPAMSVPLYWDSDGLPLGVHFTARFGREDLLLQLAHQLEEARPWFDRLPEWVTQATAPSPQPSPPRGEGGG